MWLDEHGLRELQIQHLRVPTLYIPVFEMVHKAAAKLLCNGLLGFVLKTFDSRVSDSQRHNTAGWQRQQQPSEILTVIMRVVCVEALAEQHSGRVLVYNSQVDASAEVPLKGVPARG